MKAHKLDESQEKNCRICGLNWAESHDAVRLDFIDDHCPCCGCQIGYADLLPQAALSARNKWIDKGCLWNEGKQYQPKGWNKEMALAQIKANVPTEFQ